MAPGRAIPAENVLEAAHCGVVIARAKGTRDSALPGAIRDPGRRRRGESRSSAKINFSSVADKLREGSMLGARRSGTARFPGKQRDLLRVSVASLQAA